MFTKIEKKNESGMAKFKKNHQQYKYATKAVRKVMTPKTRSLGYKSQ